MKIVLQKNTKVIIIIGQQRSNGSSKLLLATNLMTTWSDLVKLKDQV